jgi:DNA-binding response OmpR family regulator
LNKILIVDDDLDLVKLVNDILVGNGFEVFTANSGEEALSVIYDIEPDLIVLDVVLPGLSGFELCRKVKSKSTLQNTRILYLTVLGRPIDIQWMKESGADGYLIKPFEINDLINKIDELMDIK